MRGRGRQEGHSQEVLELVHVESSNVVVGINWVSKVKWKTKVGLVVFGKL